MGTQPTSGALVPWMFDADNHYYEPEDAFTRHGDADVKKFVKWVSEGRRKYIMFGSRTPTAIPNPTFNPIAKAGAFYERLKELEAGIGERALGSFERKRYGELEPLPAEYRERHARLDTMDRQGVERSMMFPTLGVGVEGLMLDNVEMAYKVFHAFNLWLEDDWGFQYQDRIYGAPYVPLLDPELAVKELDDLLERGARVISLRAGPANGRSPADPVWDGFWARMDESRAVAAYHLHPEPDEYTEAFKLLWERQQPSDLKYQATLRGAFHLNQPIIETMMALTLGNLFGRFPNVRVASVEIGSAWVEYCLHSLDHAGALLDRTISAFGTTIDDKPSEVFKRHVYISPFPEEDVPRLIEVMGRDRVLFGSDWPHPEGAIQPGDYLECLEGLGEDVVQRVMRDNALELLDVA